MRKITSQIQKKGILSIKKGKSLIDSPFYILKLPVYFAAA